MAALPKMTVVTIEDLEESMGEKRLLQQAAFPDQAFTELIEAVAIQAKDPMIRVVLISGPTASGKTTTAHRLKDMLTNLGRKPFVLSLDDYYRTKAIQYDAEGRPDYESLRTLDISMIAHDISELVKGHSVLPPTFDFKTRTRSFEPDRRICLDDNGILLVEGLHALADEITDNLPHERSIRVFVMPYGALHIDRQLLDSRDIRILRRIARDVSHRGSTALSTIDYWPMLDRTEKEMFPPYLAKADIMINTTLPYEFLVVAPIAAQYIKESLAQHHAGTLPGSFYLKSGIGYADLPLALEEARRLDRATRLIPAVSRIFVPPTSILHEFIS
jgi:uridine kinase